MSATMAEYIEWGVGVAQVWGPLLIFAFMAIESSLIPFPSEVVMIPAGVMVARHEFWGPDNAVIGLAIAVGAGLAGSMAGAYFNYYLALWLGRPFLHKYGRFVLLSTHALDRAEEIFREYGEVTTFVCRLLPAIRQLISLPAGLSRMNLFRFSLFTGLGAGIWSAVLALIGYGLGRASASKSYEEIIVDGKALIHHNLLWIVLGCAALMAGYIWVHKKVMGGGRPAAGS